MQLNFGKLFDFYIARANMHIKLLAYKLKPDRKGAV